MSTLEDKLLTYAKNNLNVLIIGTHGIGKSLIVKSIAEKLKIKFKYFSTSTLDAFADLVGIPTPDKETNSLKFYRPKDLEDAEFIFFDELSRGHPRVLNAILEIIQFKTVNGYKLPNLKIVWAAMNPSGEDYQTEELDPALTDRFHAYIEMNAEINLEYLNTKMKPEIASLLKDWWEDNLNDEQKRILTPRRIEYLGMMISNDIPWRDAVPKRHPFPVDELARKLRIMNNEEEDIIINKENILAKKDILVEKVKNDPKHAIAIATTMTKFTEDELFECRDLLESMPKELVKTVGERKFSTRKRVLREMFVAKHIDINQYPKISEAFTPE